MRQLFTLDGRPHEIGLTRPDADYRLHLDGQAVAVSLHAAGGGRGRLVVEGREHEVWMAIDGDVVHVHLDGRAYAVAYVDPVRRYATGAGGAAQDVAAAPMPGTVVALDVAAGQAVSRGDTLLVIESMKLETAIKAWRNGAVAAVHVAKGATFERGAPLVTLAPEA